MSLGFKSSSLMSKGTSLKIVTNSRERKAASRSVSNFVRREALLMLAKKYLPGLNIEGGTEWMGHRPSTPDSLPVIGRATRYENVIYAFGHGHLGLTGSATTGRVVAGIICEKGPRSDLTPFRIERFAE